MLRKFRVKNFLSFRDWQTLDLTVAGNAPEIRGRFVRSVPGSDDRFPTFVAIFGANASGKTNILHALTFLTAFVKFSQYNQPTQQIPAIPFLGDDSQPTETEFEVEIDAPLGTANRPTRFQYRVSISPNRHQVLEEELVYYPGSRARRLFLRLGQEFKFGDDFCIGRNDPSVDKIRRNSSTISTLAQFNHPLSQAIVENLDFVYSNLDNIFGGNKSYNESILDAYRQDSELIEKSNRMLRKFDTGMERIVIDHVNGRLEPQFFHQGIKAPIMRSFESQGTVNFFMLYPMLYFVVESGGIAIIDELDNTIHSLLLPEIMDMFIDPERNPRGAQLLAVCQNPSILEHLEKEEVFFAEKAPDGTSVIYGLKDIKGVRRESNIYANYLAGAFGGIPKVA